MALLELENFSCGYGEIIAASGLSFAVEAGQILALLGPNGAGKTSTMLAVMGHVQIKAGTLSVDGRDITRLPALRRAELGLALVPEGRRLFSDLTVAENLTVGGYSRSRVDEKRNLARVFDLFPRLAERRGQLAASLSGGEQQMLAIGRALMSEPKVILLDEPSLGLAPMLVEEIFGIVRRLVTQEQLSVLLVEQNATMALEVADHGYVMETGRIVLEGGVQALRDNSDIREFYLGLNVVGSRKSYRDVKHYKRRKRWLS